METLMSRTQNNSALPNLAMSSLRSGWHSISPPPNPALNRTACKLRLQVPSAFGSGGRLALR
jgi:hypothetical protein